MSSAVTNLPNGAVVVTHFFPPGTGTGQTAAPSPTLCLGQTVSSLGQTVSSMTKQFLKGHPKALGTVQIMIGLMVFVFGIAMTLYADTFGVMTGIFAWGAIIYIAAGSLTVAAASSNNTCVLKGSLGMNIFAALASCVGVILHSMDAAGVLFNWYCDWHGDYNASCETIEEVLRVRSGGISGVLAVFSLLECIVSICVSAFACKATGCCSNSPPQPDQVFIIGNHLAQQSAVIPQVYPPNVYEAVRDPKGSEDGAVLTAAHLGECPPQYSATLLA